MHLVRRSVVRARVGAALAAAVVSLGLLAGCGSTDASADLRPVADLTDESFASTVGSAVADAGSAHVAAEGALLGMPVSVDGDVAGGGAPEDLLLALASADGALDVRLVDQVVYAKVDPFTGGRFLRVDLGDPDDPLAAQVESFTDMVDVDGLLDDLDGAVSVEPSGGAPVTIDGVETVAYDVTVDAARLGGPSRGAGAGTVTVYLGPDALPRRVVADRGGSPFTIDLSAWGEPVSVDAPPADEVSDQSASDLLGGLFGGLGGAA